MAQAVLKWGNSLAFRIPSVIAKRLGIEEGSEFELRVEGKRLVLERASDLPKFSHRDLVNALQKSKTKLVDFGSPRGDEVL
jgi:antitoxin MazE